ncbi:M43 family zinc metalloprotease [Hymenobacter sp.]|uniref:M43 family zinc metalloprotease n=1 Tax=Hymenobacter sp. TaxID=1898978 RepID=UPI002EDA8B83
MRGLLALRLLLASAALVGPGCDDDTQVLDPSSETASYNTGITRTLSPHGQASNDELLKRAVRWDPARYLNIWVVDDIGAVLSSTAGYSFLPCTAGSSDGAVIRKASFGTIGGASGNLNPHVLSHELGHYFGLSHTCGSTNAPGVTGNCALGDGIADRPATIGTYTCDLAFTSCTDPGTGQPILANVQNSVDYTSCSNMFTTGQRTVIRASLALGCRSTLTTAANLAATGTADGFQPPAGGCPPFVTIGTDLRQVCLNQTGGPRYFTGLGNSDALNAPTAQVRWSFPGGVPATSTARFERVSYPTPGLYPVTLTITPAGGLPVSRTEQNWMQVRGPGTGLTGPVNESFETPTFPYNFGPADLRNWLLDTLRRPTACRWQRVSGSALVAADGTACISVPNAPVTAGSPNFVAITSPVLDLSALQGRPAQRSFRTAWAIHPTVQGSGNDQLLVQYGTDCEVFSNITGQVYISGRLQAAGQAPQSGFVPTSAPQWTTFTLLLNQQYIGPNTWVRFQFRSTGGNPIYLDQVRIYDVMPHPWLLAQKLWPA